MSTQGETILRITTITQIIVPKGTTVLTAAGGGHSEIILPSGESLKSFVVFEKDEEGDLSSVEMENLGCYAEDISRVIEEAD